MKNAAQAALGQPTACWWVEMVAIAAVRFKQMKSPCFGSANGVN